MGSATQDLRIEPADGGRAREDFIRLPERLYGGQPGFVAPLRLERRMSLSPKHNPWFQHGGAQLWVAYRGSTPVGRISAQVDRLHLERYGDATGHFGFLDAADDPVLFARLTNAAESWLRQQGMRRAVGPLNLSINEEVGLLVDGFAARPMLMMGYGAPYADARLTALGYGKARDVLAYDYDITRDITPQTAARLKRARATPDVAVRPLDMKRYNEELAVIIDIFNDAWSQNWGFIPFTQAEMEAIAKSMKPLVKPELVAIAAIRGGAPAAMLVALPNLAEAIADLGGRLLPFGWAKLLWRLHRPRPRTMRVPLMGVVKRLQATRLASQLAFMMIEYSRRAGVEVYGADRGEIGWILDDNVGMRSIAETIDSHINRVYRIYEKPL